MNKLPEGWAKCQLADVGLIVTGKTPSTKEPKFYGGTIPFIKPGDLDNAGPIVKTETCLTEAGLAEVPILPPKSIVVTCIGNLGKIGITTRNSATNQQINSVVPVPEVEPQYLFHYCRILRPWLEENSSATTISIINKGIFSSAPVLLPPLAEQTRIAQKLDELLAQVDTLKARIDGIPALLKRFRQSVLAAAVSGRLTEGWRGHKRLSDIREVELSSLIDKGPQNGLYKPSSAYGKGVKIIRIDSFYSGEIKAWASLRSLEVNSKELDVWAVKKNDILINRVNSIEYLGKSALVRSIPEPAVFESNIMRLSLNLDLVVPEYLMRFLSSEHGRKRLIANAKHAVNQASINQGDVKSCKVPLPSLEEQTEIVRRVEQLFAFADQLEVKVKTAQARIDQLTQSILAKAFRGELVPQDPSDEPASILLERIKAQRAAEPKAKRSRKKAEIL